MKIAIAATFLFAPQDSERAPVPPSAESASPRAAPVLAGMRQAKEALQTWRAAAEAGSEVDLAELKPVQQELLALVEELKALHARAQARAYAELELPPRGEPTQEEKLQVGRAREIASAWTEDARALGDGARERRERALASMRGALQGGDPTASLAALQVLSSIGDVEYDKVAFRPLVLPLAQNARGPIATSALRALFATEHRPEDLALVHAAWQRAPEGFRDGGIQLLKDFGGGRIEGRSEEIALELLSGRDQDVNVQFGGLWGAEVGSRLEERVLELARSTDHEMRHAAIYFGLSTFKNKSRAVVDALIATLADPDHNDSGRALWGLGQGVPVDLQRHVATALVDLHNSRSDPTTRSRCARIVKEYGGPELEAKLKR